MHPGNGQLEPFDRGMYDSVLHHLVKPQSSRDFENLDLKRAKIRVWAVKARVSHTEKPALTPATDALLRTANRQSAKSGKQVV